jgi:hypothetical protein
LHAKSGFIDPEKLKPGARVTFELARATPEGLAGFHAASERRTCMKCSVFTVRFDGIDEGVDLLPVGVPLCQVLFVHGISAVC